MTGIVAAGQYELITMSIKSHNGFVMDLRQVMASLEIYEDIYSTSMTARLGIVTTEDLVTVLPIIGQEEVIISVDHPGGRKQIDLHMVVHKIVGFERDNMSTKFILELVTLDYILNFQTKISQYFEGPSSDIASQVLSLMGASKPVSAVSSDDEQKIVIPNFTAFRTCNWMTEKAYKGDSANYVFYESKDNYVFSPLSELVLASPKIEYKAQPPNLDGDPNFEDKIIQSYTLKSSFDVVQNILSGMYNSRAITVDLITRSFKDISYSFWDEYQNVPHLTNNPLFDISGQGTQYNPANLYVLPENPFLTYNNKETNLKRRSQLQLFNNLKMDLTVFGDTELGSGDTVNLTFPIFNPLSDGAANNYLSGNWLVTAVKHRFEQEAYYIDMECVRDSTDKPLPQPQPTK